MTEPQSSHQRIDRIIGYVLVLIVALIAGTVSIVLFSMAMNPPQMRVVYFDEVGHITLDDPVQIKGLIVGKISEITPVGNRVAITMTLSDPVDIHEGYKISTFDKGIMGDRVISIETSGPQMPLIPPKDTLEGVFYIGVSEVLGLAYKIEDAVDLVDEIIETMLIGNEDTPPFVERFYDILGIADTLTENLKTGISTLNREFGPALDSIDNVVTAVNKTTRLLSSKLPQSVEKLERTIVRLTEVVTKLEVIIGEAQKVVAEMDDREKKLWAADLNKTINGLKNVQEVLESLYEGTGKLRLIISRWK